MYKISQGFSQKWRPPYKLTNGKKVDFQREGALWLFWYDIILKI